MPGVEQSGGVRPRRGTVGGHDHALARGEPVVLDHPRLVLGAVGAEPVQRGVQMCRVVDDLAAGGANPDGRHHVFGERLRALDPGGGRRRPEACDACRTHRVRDAEHQRHFGPDDHQVGARVDGELGDGLTGGDVDGHAVRPPPRCRRCPERRSGRRLRDRAAAPSAGHVHGHRSRSPGRAQQPTLMAQSGARIALRPIQHLCAVSQMYGIHLRRCIYEAYKEVCDDGLSVRPGLRLHRPRRAARGHAGQRVRRTAQDRAGLVERAAGRRHGVRRRRLLGDQPPRGHQGHLEEQRRCGRRTRRAP